MPSFGINFYPRVSEFAGLIFFHSKYVCAFLSLCVRDLERDDRKIHIYMSFCWNGQADLLVGIHYIIIMDAKSMNRWITFNSLFFLHLLWICMLRVLFGCHSTGAIGYLCKPFVYVQDKINEPEKKHRKRKPKLVITTSLRSHTRIRAHTYQWGNNISRWSYYNFNLIYISLVSEDTYEIRVYSKFFAIYLCLRKCDVRFYRQLKIRIRTQRQISIGKKLMGTIL